MAYKQVDPKVFNKNTETARSRKTGSNDMWSPAVGKVGAPIKSVARFMPPHENMPDVIIEGKVHFSLGPNDDIGCGCLGYYGEECPACVQVDGLFAQAKREPDPETAAKIKAKAMDKRAQLRFYANIVDMLKPEDGVQPYAFGPTVEKMVRNTFYDDDGEFRDVSHPSTGRDLMFMVSTKPNTTWPQYDEIRAKEKTSALADPAWLEQIKDMTEFTKKPTRAAIEGALKGIRPGATATRTGPTGSSKAAPTGAGKPIVPPAAQVTAPAAAPAPAAVPKPKRSPVGTAVPAEPFAQARAEILRLGFTSPIDLKPEEVDGIPKPDCYTKETDPTDPQCQGCRVLLPCLTALKGYAA